MGAAVSDNTCRFCQRRMVRNGPKWTDRGRTVDHILPRSRGGTNAPWNQRIICRSCNETLGAFGNCAGALAAIRAVIGIKPVAECLRWWREQGREAERRRLLEETKPERWCAPLVQERVG